MCYNVTRWDIYVHGDDVDAARRQGTNDQCEGCQGINQWVEQQASDSSRDIPSSIQMEHLIEALTGITTENSGFSHE